MEIALKVKGKFKVKFKVEMALKKGSTSEEGISQKEDVIVRVEIALKVKVKFKVKFQVKIVLKEVSASEEGIAQKEEIIFQEILFMEEIVVQQSEVFGFVIESFQWR